MIQRLAAPRIRGLGRLLLAAEVVLAMVFVLRQFTPVWEARWVQDDAYVSFRYAKHLVEGHGLVYNPGERVEGYTNFLWTVVSAIPLAQGQDDPLRFMHAFGMALWLGSYLLLLGVGIRLFHAGIWIAPLAVVPLTQHYSFNLWFVSGMETPLVCFLTILTVFFFTFDAEKRPKMLAMASLSGVLLTMTRPDGIVVMAALGLAAVAVYWRPIVVQRQWRRFLLPAALPVVVVFAPFTLWRIVYYGSFFPNTYYTKVAYLSFYSRGWEYLTTYLGVYQVGRYLILLLLGAIVVPPGPAQRFLWGVSFAAGAIFFYVVRLGGDFMEWRFVTPASGLLYPAIVIGAAMLAERVFYLVQLVLKSGLGMPPLAGEPKLLRTYGGVLGWATGALFAVSLSSTTAAARQTAQEAMVPGQETIQLLRRYCDPGEYDWGLVGRVLDEVLPKDVRIATTSAGIIPFYCDRPCLDLHGLTDPVIAREPVDPDNRGRLGHEHWLQDFDVMRQRGVDIYLYWADPKPHAVATATPAKKDFEVVSVRLPTNQFVEFLILNHAAVDMEALRRDPRLVFSDEKALADRGESRRTTEISVADPVK